ncbi:MAG: hypothetical protein ACK56F_10935, partial [bacterium]
RVQCEKLLFIESCKYNSLMDSVCLSVPQEHCYMLYPFLVTVVTIKLTRRTRWRDWKRRDRRAGIGEEGLK